MAEFGYNREKFVDDLIAAGAKEDEIVAAVQEKEKRISMVRPSAPSDATGTSTRLPPGEYRPEGQVTPGEFFFPKFTEARAMERSAPRQLGGLLSDIGTTALGTRFGAGLLKYGAERQAGATPEAARKAAVENIAGREEALSGGLAEDVARSPMLLMPGVGTGATGTKIAAGGARALLGRSPLLREVGRAAKSGAAAGTAFTIPMTGERLAEGESKARAGIGAIGDIGTMAAFSGATPVVGKALGKVPKAVLHPVKTKTEAGKKLIDLGERFMGGDLKITKSLAQRGYGKTVDEKKRQIIGNIKKYNLHSVTGDFADMSQKADELAWAKQAQVDDEVRRLATEPGAEKVNPAQLVRESLNDFKPAFGKSKRTRAILDNIIEDMGAEGLDQAVTIDRLIDAKRRIDANGNLFRLGPQPLDIDPLDTAIRKYIYLKFTDKIGDISPLTKQLNREMKELLDIRAVAADASGRILNRDALGLSDIIIGSTALLHPGSLLYDAGVIGVKKGLGQGRGAAAIIKLGEKLRGPEFRAVNPDILRTPGIRDVLSQVGRQQALVPSTAIQMGERGVAERLPGATGTGAPLSRILGRIAAEGQQTETALPIHRPLLPSPADVAGREEAVVPMIGKRMPPAGELPAPMIETPSTTRAERPLPPLGRRIAALGAEEFPGAPRMSRAEVEASKKRLARLEERNRRLGGYPLGGRLGMMGGGGVIGGTVGATQGETPEERARNAVLGAGAGLGGELGLGAGLGAGLVKSQIGRLMPTLSATGQRIAKDLGVLQKINTALRSKIRSGAAIGVAGMHGDRRESIHTINAVLQNDPTTRKSLLAIQRKNPDVDFVDEQGFLKPIAIEEVQKPDPESVLQSMKGSKMPVRKTLEDELRGMGLPTTGSTMELAARIAEVKGITKPKFGGFKRSLTQMYWDALNPTVREDFRQQMYQDTRRAFEEGRLDQDLFGMKGKGKPISAIESEAASDFSMPSPLRTAEKTGAALNSTTACPMFTVGNTGCWGDACYVTQQGAGGNTYNLFKNAPYTGEILRMTDDEIKTMNKIYGGLRINGSGDYTREQAKQLRDIINDANTRGVDLKYITKQEEAIADFQRMANEGIDVSRVIVQPSFDYMWIPAKIDLERAGAGVHSMQIGEAIAAGRPEAAAEAYRQAFGREAKVINGELYRKFGFSLDKVGEMQRKYPNVKVEPRAVVGTVEEAVETALAFPESEGAIITLMHGKLPDYIKSDIGGNLMNWGGRHDIKFSNGMLSFTSDKGTSSAHKALADYVNKNYPLEQRAKIYRTLKKSVCCQAGESKDACADCAAHCASREVVDHLTTERASKTLGSRTEGPMEQLGKGLK